MSASVRFPLFVGAAYFLLVSIAHAVGVKVPGLFIYFNVPSFAYQDRIISLLSFGWAIFFLSTALRPSKPHLYGIIVAGLGAICMLTANNLATPFISMDPTIDPRIFHAQAGALFCYWVWLVKAVTFP